MTDVQSGGRGTAGPAEVVVKHRKGIPVVWIIPLVAALIGGWLWMQALQEQGPTVTITFETAEGLEAGKTKIRLKDVEVGHVTDVRLDEDDEHVLVTAELVPSARRWMVGSTRFWVVRPRIGASGVSGLGTLLSGAYLMIEPGSTGEKTLEFTGLEQPPMSPADAPGLKLKIVADELGSLGTGTPVLYRRMQVGTIEQYTFVAERQEFEFDVYIEEPYAQFVRANTRFWNVSGVRVTLDASGVELQADSLETVLSGGVAFGLPDGLPAGPPAASAARFELHADESSAMELYTQRRRCILYFSESVRGLEQGAPVEIRGIEYGQVLDVSLELDPRTGELRIPVLIEIEPERIRVLGMTEMPAESERQALFDQLIGFGLRAQLASGSLLTGSLYIDLGFHPDTPVTLVGADDRYPEIPTIPSTSETLQRTLAELPEIVADLRDAMQGISDVVNSDDLSSTLGSIAKASADVATLTGSLGGDIQQLMGRLDAIAADVGRITTQAESMLAQVGAEADPLARLLERALLDLSASLRSVRQLAETLELQPEALLKGKSADG